MKRRKEAINPQWKKNMKGGQLQLVRLKWAKSIVAVF